MKKLFLSFVFVIFLGLFLLPVGNKAEAVNLPDICIPEGLPCVAGPVNVCCSGFTCKLKIGIMKCVPDDGSNPLLELLIQPTPPPPPAPPCASKDANGKCTSTLTAFGVISTQPGEFVGRVAGFLIAAAGMIAVLLIVRAGYRIITSRGKPEALQQGREQFIAAVVGLLFIIFSFVILQVIGVDLLRTPGFSGNDGEGFGPGIEVPTPTPRQGFGPAN